jgi:predicted GNAT family N-acyltransferase
MSLVIRWATGHADQRRVHELRERVFVHEQGLAYDRLDAEIDAYSSVLLAELDGRLVAALRLTRRSEGPFEDEHALQLPLWRRAFTDAELLQVSRFVVEPAQRASAVQLRMLTAAYEHVRAAGGRACLLDCAPSLVAYYQRIGFRRFAPAYVHPTLGGEYVPLVMFIDDLPHFQRTHALLGRVADVDGAQRARALFERHVAPEFLFADVGLGACERPFAYYFVNETLRDEAREFELRRLALGESWVVRRRLVVVRSGSIHVEHEGRSALLGPGQHVGEAQVLAWRGSPIHIETLDDAELMLLTPEQFVEQTTRHAGLALTLLTCGRSRPHAPASRHTPPPAAALKW